jgi:hypothetical protein
MIGYNRLSAAGSRAPACCTGAGKPLWRPLLTTMILMVLLGLPAVAAEKSPWSPPALPEPTDEVLDGRAIVQRALGFIEGHPELAFEALVTYEAVQENGQKLQFDMLQRVARRLPNQLFWMTLFDDASAQSAWCNSGEFTLLMQPANIWGQIKVPPTIAAAVSRISGEYDIDVPFVDLLSGEAAELWLGEDVHSIEFIGAAWVDGWWTDHIAIRKPGIDFELWFRQGDEPFLMKIALVYTDEAQMPGYSARFHKWSTTIPDNAIPKFVPPSGSEPVDLVPVVGN